MRSMNFNAVPYVKFHDIPNKMNTGLNHTNNVHFDTLYEHPLSYENVIIQITRIYFVV